MRRYRRFVFRSEIQRAWCYDNRRSLMNCAVRVLALCLLLPAAQSFAKDFNKVAYVAGTLPLARFTKGQFEASDERECVIAWSGGKQQTRVPFGRIVFAEQGSYSSKNTLGPLGLDEKVHLYLTLITATTRTARRFSKWNCWANTTDCW